MVSATPRPLYCREKDPVPIVWEAGWVQGRSGWMRKTSPHPELFFVFILLHSVLHPYLFLCLDCPAFCLFVFTYKTQQKYPCPRRDFLFVLCTSSVLLLCPDCPGCAFCPYCTTHTTQTSMPPAGFEPAVPASDRPHTLALDRLATGNGRIRSLARPARSESLYRLRVIIMI